MTGVKGLHDNLYGRGPFPSSEYQPLEQGSRFSDQGPHGAGAEGTGWVGVEAMKGVLKSRSCRRDLCVESLDGILSCLELRRDEHQVAVVFPMLPSRTPLYIP